MLRLALALLADPVPPPPLPEPTPLPRHTRAAVSTGPDYFLTRRERPRLGLRIGYGLAGHVAGAVPARAAFDLDVILGGRISTSRRKPQFILVPELGYNLTAGAHATRSHLVTVGLGLGAARHRHPTLAFIPRFVAGSMLRQPALGLRAGVLIEGGEDVTLGVEFAYQALFLPGGAVHTLHFTFHVGAFSPVR